MTQALDTQLDALKAAAETQTETYQNSRQQLYENFVDTYLWWREAINQPKYLAAKYKAAGLPNRQLANNKPNFASVIRLVWNIPQSKHSGAVTNWNNSMRRLDEAFIDNFEAFKSEPRTHLLNYIHANGGLGGLRGEKAPNEQDLEDEQAGGSQQTAQKPKVPTAQAITEQYRSAAVKTAPLAKLADFPNAVTSDDGLIVMLGRRSQTGEIEIVGTDYSETSITSALAYCANIDRASVTPSLRLLAESLEPHALPKKLEKQRKRYFEDSTIARKNAAGQKQVVKINTTLRIRPHVGDILVSKSPTTASVVSHIKPKSNFDFTAEVTLNGKDRQWIEAQLLGQEKLTLYTAEPEMGYEADTSTRVADYNITLTETGTAKTRRLHFYDVAKLPDVSAVQQPFVSDASEIDYDWTMEVTKQWLAELDATCLAAWIKRISGKHNKPENRTVMLELTDAGMLLRAWWDKDAQMYQQHYALNTEPPLTRQKLGTTAWFRCAAKDFVPLFSSLPNITLETDRVLIQANQNVMNISYETALAEVQHYIPAADTEGERDDTAFSNTLDVLEQSE